MTHVARQFHSNVSTEREVLPLQIPRKLLFNYKIDLFKAENSDLSRQEEILLANVKRTVKVFEDITGDAPEVEMWGDDHCLTALDELQMKEGHALAFGFKREVEGRIKSDLCRLVMLYNTGGYYFDTDVAPLAALQRVLDPRATFVTVRAQRDGFFQAFVATTPKHPVIKLSLMKFKTWYDKYWTPGQDKNKLRDETGHGQIGCALLERSKTRHLAGPSGRARVAVL